MSEPLSTFCDHCDAKLKLKNPDLEGKKIKCPKCGEAFVVLRAADIAPVKKPVKKAADDDDMDFMNVDADDYDSPVEDDEDRDDDDAPRGRRRPAARGGKKKSKKKKGSGNSAQVFTIIALMLVALTVLGGGGFAMMTLLKGDGSSDVDWLPSDIEGFVKVQVDDLWAANVVQPLKNSTVTTAVIDDMTKNVGLGPQDIDRMVISLPPNSASDKVVVVARAKTAFDKAKIQAADKSLTEVSLNATTYYKSNTAALFFPDPKTLVLGSETLVKSLIERGKKHPSAAKFAFANNYRDHLVIAASNPSSSVRSSMAYPGGQDVEAVLIRGNAASDIRLSIRGTFKSADAAKASVEKTKADTEKAKKDFATNKSAIQNAPDNPLMKKEQVLKMMNGAEQLMNSMQVSQSGNQVTINLTVSGQLVSDFTEMAGSMPGSPLRRFTPFGR